MSVLIAIVYLQHLKSRGAIELFRVQAQAGLIPQTDDVLSSLCRQTKRPSYVAASDLYIF